MGVDVVKKTTPPRATKLLSLTLKRTIQPYAGGVDQFTLTHGLGYIPPFKIFFQSNDDHPERMFTALSNYDNNVPALQINGYNKFTMGFFVTTNLISFGVTNRDTVAHDIKIFALVYAERATASQ